jgi:predicted RND superfamily exporter protein
MTFIHQPTEFEKKQQDKEFIERLQSFCKNQLEKKPKIMSKQTVVEWLDQEIINFYGSVSIYKTKQEIIEQAKEMFEEQIIDAWLSAWKDSMINPLEDKYYQPEAEQYYNTTFKK